MDRPIDSRPDEAPVALPTPRAGYQGLPGSFSARAAARVGRPVEHVSFDRLLRALVAEEIDVAVLPAATRGAGPVLEPLEALARALEGGTKLIVASEIEVPVRLVLAAPRGVATADVKELHSQSPVFRQCAKLLARLDAAPVETHDTALAAFRVAELGGARAAVCSEEAALDAGLVVLEEDVSDVRPNATRFWAVVRSAPDVEPEVRTLYFAGARLAAALTDADAEMLTLPGRPDAPLRGFAVVPLARLSKSAALSARTGETLVWLGPTPDHTPPPRLRDLPRATEVRPLSSVTVGRFAVGAGRRAVIAGPCAVESPEQVMRLAKAVARAGATALRGGVFKPRTSPYAFQGHGLEGLDWLKAAGDAVGLPIVTEVMAPGQVEKMAEKADVLQIGARNCQNYDLLREAGGSGRPVLLKRGFGTTVEEWLASAEYLLAAGGRDVMLCERGIRTFEKATRGTLDLGGLLVARSLTHLPLLADPSHAAGRRELVAGLARAAWGAGADGLMIEVHDAPESALCDGPQAMLPDDLEALLDEFGLLPGPTDSVERVRRAIDAVDAGIAGLVSRRLALCRAVAATKRATGRPIRDEAREATVRARFEEALGGDAPNAAVLADALISLGLDAEGWEGATRR